MKRKKRWLKVLIGVLALFLMIDIIASFFFYNLAIKRGEKEFLQDNADLEVSAQAMDEFTQGDWRNWVRNQPFEEMELTSYDGLKLAGYFLPAKRPSNKLVIFSHGYLGNAKQMGLYGQYYYEQLGYNIFMADARGHGNSEGDYYGFGWHDRLDLIDWTQQLIGKLGDDTEVVYHGLSMGAATVLMASGEKLPNQVKAIIADSPYSDVYGLFAYQMKRMFHLPAFPFLDSTSVVTKFKADYSLKEASSLHQVEKAKVPIFYIHGNADTFVPTEMTKELYSHTKSPAEMWLVDNANHGESFVIAKEEYIKRLNKFLKQYVQ
ncbi:alpha/beta hydrolase [Virgibacillus soli]|uniref:alpha/beta hydrolase n=1 Tax=Paracerasibacillus soli TaxID=480284 RepID=UPI0035E8BCC4